MGKRQHRVMTEIEREVLRRSRAVRRLKARGLSAAPAVPSLPRRIAAVIYAMNFEDMAGQRQAFAAASPGARALAKAEFHYCHARTQMDRAMWIRRGGRLP